VRTLAGNGTKGSDYQGGGKGTDQARPQIHGIWIHLKHLGHP